MEREPNTVYILSLSYGKDSLACIEACKRLGYPLDRIVHAEVWATDTISADLPPMVEFKRRADEIIRERYGIEVEHVCAMKDGKKMTYERMFYQRVRHRPETLEKIAGGGTKHRLARKFGTDFLSYGVNGVPQLSSRASSRGFPLTTGGWCRKLKIDKVLPALWRTLRISASTDPRVVQTTQERPDQSFR